MDAESRFRALFKTAYPALRRYAQHRGLTGADADDLVAGTLEIAWRRIEVVPADDPMPWLYVVARNLLRNKNRKDGRRTEILARTPPAGPPVSGDPAELAPAELRGALASLSEDDQEVLRLIAWDGLTPSQAALVLDCTAIAVRSRLHRARNRLAARLGLDPRVQRSEQPRHVQDDNLNLKEVSGDPSR